MTARNMKKRKEVLWLENAWKREELLQMKESGNASLRIGSLSLAVNAE